MTWLQRYHLRHYLANSLWPLPALSAIVAIVAVRVLHDLETSMGWESSFRPETAQAFLGTMASSMFTFIVFVSSALLVALQLASSQLSPRIIAVVFRDSVIKISLVVFVFTFTFTLAVLIRVTTHVPPLTAYMAGYSCVASLIVFLYLVDHVGKSLRPSGALWAVTCLGRKVIDSVYPQRLTETPGNDPVTFSSPGVPARIIPSPKDGVVQAFDVPGMVSLAHRANCVIEMVPQVGDFIAVGDPLFRIYQGGERLSPDRLCELIAVGQERTLEQDPAFVFRIMVDIACKGLSPAINDPTTAVLALDQIHHLLRYVGERQLSEGQVRDPDGRLRLLYRTPNWEDFVALAVTEIRQYGGTSIQIARRLRAMLENLIQTLPEDRAPLLRQELDLVHRSAERFFSDPEDRALADVSDYQGVGGKKVPGSS
jgi:uncharacterized membrane protein